MLKQVVITGIAAMGLMLSVQASAHQSNSHTVRINHGHSGHHQPVKPPKFRVNREQREQANMIKQGIKTCQITPQEARKLNAQQNRIKKAERRMRKDGLQHWERSKLKQRLHNARVNINRLTKNAKNCRPKRWNRSNAHHGHHGNANRRHNNNHVTGTWDLTSGRGTIGISIGH